VIHDDTSAFVEGFTKLREAINRRPVEAIESRLHGSRNEKRNLSEPVQFAIGADAH